jgi:cyclopropane fatty-acyl-phospholipid synthase-like methyltransferase
MLCQIHRYNAAMQGSYPRAYPRAAQSGFSSASERNRQPIAAALKEYLRDGHAVVEVGSGTGQHAVYFGSQFPQVRWQPCDTGEYLQVLRSRLQDEAPSNVDDAVELDVRMAPWPIDTADIIFSANTLHFMGEDCVEAFFRGVGQVLRSDGQLLVYGPFNYGGEFTSPSNAAFDQRLRAGDPVRGIRDFEWVHQLAQAQGLCLQADVEMPANNRFLIWAKATTA